MNVIVTLVYNERVSPVEVSFRKDMPLAGSAEAIETLAEKSQNHVWTFDNSVDMSAVAPTMYQ